jgi:tetraacyldisaccharide 4'-kinase
MLKFVLYPFAILYDGITRFRNHLYNKGLKPSVAFDIPVISVGNLTVGGTGKTPMIEYLIRLLSPQYTVATLSRGYGRSSKGFIIADDQSDASLIGDEPYQLFKKFKSVTVAVGEERALAIPLMLQENENLQVILLDDAFQHRRVRPSLQILLTDFNRLFFNDCVLPAGRLRESKTGAARADVIVVTKCPFTLSAEERQHLQIKIRSIADKPVFFTAIGYEKPIAFPGTRTPIGKEVILVTGIANATPLKAHVEKHFSVRNHLEFPDHHVYTAEDLRRILEKSGPDVSVITTEKDMAKLDVPAFAEYLNQSPFFYLPITVQFLNNSSDFDRLIRHHIEAQLG